MNRYNKTFVSDPRNLGGRAQILELMQNHQSYLKKIKSVIRIKSPHPHVNSVKPADRLIRGNLLFVKHTMFSVASGTEIRHDECDIWNVLVAIGLTNK